MDAILARRSIRKYTPEPVADQVITELLAAAMSAPSAGNEQPWHFVVLKERRLLDKIPEFHPHSLMLKEAPVAILICGQPKTAKYDGQYWVQDCSAATENILLAAQARGLGSVWLGIHPIEERVTGLRHLLGLPDEIVPFSLVPIGHPAEQKPPAGRYDAARVHHDRW